jgi:hypothetical protein
LKAHDKVEGITSMESNVCVSITWSRELKEENGKENGRLKL